MTEKEHLARKTGGASSPTILLVAPDPGMRKMLHMALKVEFECEVLPFNNGRSALAMAVRARPDIMVIYSLFPDLNALELADQLHRINGWDRVPVILAHLPEASHSQNQDPYLIILYQPFTLEKLYTAIHTCLDHL